MMTIRPFRKNLSSWIATAPLTSFPSLAGDMAVAVGILGEARGVLVVGCLSSGIPATATDFFKSQAPGRVVHFATRL